VVSSRTATSGTTLASRCPSYNAEPRHRGHFAFPRIKNPDRMACTGHRPWSARSISGRWAHSLELEVTSIEVPCGLVAGGSSSETPVRSICSRSVFRIHAGAAGQLRRSRTAPWALGRTLPPAVVHRPSPRHPTPAAPSPQTTPWPRQQSSYPLLPSRLAKLHRSAGTALTMVEEPAWRTRNTSAEEARSAIWIVYEPFAVPADTKI